MHNLLPYSSRNHLTWQVLLGDTELVIFRRQTHIQFIVSRRGVCPNLRPL